MTDKFPIVFIHLCTIGPFIDLPFFYLHLSYIYLITGVIMNIIIPRDLIQFIDQARRHLSRPAYMIKCVAYIKINNITIDEIESTINKNYERNYEHDRFDNTNKKRKDRHQS